MSRRLLGLIVATLTLGYGSVFDLLAEIRARFGFDDWAVGMIGAAGFAAGFASQAFLSRLADRGYLRRLLGGGLACALHRRKWAVIVFLRQLRHCSSTLTSRSSAEIWCRIHEQSFRRLGGAPQGR